MGFAVVDVAALLVAVDADVDEVVSDALAVP